ncbi:hypothetical protein [Cellulomonas soli]|uniref:Glycosyl transferase n=1 Tax=Cellulomonas soli TaxID=931535 RepID=A0A512PH33_9CELL|nr:hypothetical protein [Cellulomonas soli]NYI60900.1 UDP-N-acetylmuramyl pentapeptide phosphotransferase/UDP-N-acetylglucosamine-1-phosphate transferase [Cellulomonas soli]GEP70516.1 hypothetical protein CSO01_32310 [Cellulomonas soli]
MSVGSWRRGLAFLAAGTTTAVVRGLLDGQAPGGAARWTRTNHRGEPVSMLEGPAVAAGVLAGSLVGAPSVRGAWALGVATSSAAVFGVVDDLAEDVSSRRKGLRGHLGALAHGELTTGGLKVLGIGAGALVAAALATPRRRGGAVVGPGAWTADVLASGALIATSANLVNLLDLRPGRALKASAMVAAPLAVGGGQAGSGAGAACAVLGAGAAALDQDLDEADMLGDGGANALGAALGTAVVLAAPRGVRLTLLAGVVALTVISEKVSFTRVIERTPVLRDIDAWGRRPVEPAGR